MRRGHSKTGKKPFKLLPLLIDIVAFPELVDTTGGVYKSLRASVKRMTVGTDTNVNRGHCRAGLDNVAASTGDDAIRIFRMNLLFHYNLTFMLFWFQKQCILSEKPAPRKLIFAVSIQNTRAAATPAQASSVAQAI